MDVAPWLAAALQIFFLPVKPIFSNVIVFAQAFWVYLSIFFLTMPCISKTIELFVITATLIVTIPLRSKQCVHGIELPVSTIVTYSVIVFVIILFQLTDATNASKDVFNRLFEMYR